jgi:cell wall-associated NlpC family hydrolase
VRFGRRTIRYGRRTPRRRLAFSLGGAVALMLTLPAVSVADPQPTLAEVQKQVDELLHHAEQAAERYNAANDRLTDLQRQVAAAQADVDRQKAKLTDVTKVMGGFAAASYRTGAVDPTMQVFLAEDPREFLAQASVVDAYAAQQVGALRLVAVERQRLAEHQATAGEQVARVQAVQSTLQKEKQSFEGKLATAQRLLSTLKAEERAALERERAAREQASRSAARQAQDTLRQNAAAVATGKATQPKQTSQSTSSPPASGKGATALEFALAQVGEPYVYGGDGPNSWDCSGLTMMAWKAAGVSLPHGAKAQYASTPHVSKSALQPGDLVFFYSPIHHVGIYAGNGKIVHAPKPGDVVSVVPLDYMPYAGASRPA